MQGNENSNVAIFLIFNNVRKSSIFFSTFEILIYTEYCLKLKKKIYLLVIKDFPCLPI